MALRVCTYPSTGWMSSSPPGGTAAFADARDDRGTTIPTLPPLPPSANDDDNDVRGA